VPQELTPPRHQSHSLTSIPVYTPGRAPVQMTKKAPRKWIQTEDGEYHPESFNPAAVHQALGRGVSLEKEHRAELLSEQKDVEKKHNKKKEKDDTRLLTNRIKELKLPKSDEDNLLAAFHGMIETFDMKPGNKAKAAQEKEAVTQIMSILKAHHGLSQSYTNLQNKKGFNKDAPGDVHLWSKMQSRIPRKDAEKTGGKVLESTVGGTLMDGLNWGRPWGHSRAIADLWTELSATFANEATGDVHAHFLRGVHGNSVLTRDEMPKIHKGIANESNPLRSADAHFYTVAGNQIKRTTKKAQDMSTPEAFAKLEAFPDSGPLGETRLEEHGQSVSRPMEMAEASNRFRDDPTHRNRPAMANLPIREGQTMLNQSQQILNSIEEAGARGGTTAATDKNVDPSDVLAMQGMQKRV
jgi:hypothetical protein